MYPGAYVVLFGPALEQTRVWCGAITVLSRPLLDTTAQVVCRCWGVCAENKRDSVTSRRFHETPRASPAVAGCCAMPYEVKTCTK